MPIEITDDPVVRLTASEAAKWRERYNQQFSGYGLTPPSFSSWVAKQLQRASQKAKNKRIGI
jgi:hypothetical protein